MAKLWYTTVDFVEFTHKAEQLIHVCNRAKTRKQLP